jgi:hypothetical protein
MYGEAEEKYYNSITYGTMAKIPAGPPAILDKPVIVEPPPNLYQQKKMFVDLVGPPESIIRKFLCCIFTTHPDEHDLPVHEHVDDCSICTSEALGNEVWVITPCKHTFHVECIRDWIKTFEEEDKGCPLCRAKIQRKIKKGFIVS